MLTLRRAELSAELAYLMGRTRQPVGFTPDAMALRVSALGDSRRETVLVPADGAFHEACWFYPNELASWLGLVTDETVQFTQRQGQLRGAHAYGTITVPTLVVRPPEKASAPVTGRLALAASVATSLLADVAFAAPNYWTPHVDGTLFEIIAGRLAVAAGDGHILAVSELALDQPDLRVVLPYEALTQAQAILRGSTADLEMTVHGSYLRLVCGTRETTTPLASQGRFPAYRKFYPKGLITADTPKTALVDAVALGLLDGCTSATLTLDTDMLRLSIGDTRVGLSATCVGEGEMRVSTDKLLRVLKSLRGDRAVIAFDGPMSPIKISAVGGDASYLLARVSK